MFEDIYIAGEFYHSAAGYYHFGYAGGGFFVTCFSVEKIAFVELCDDVRHECARVDRLSNN